MFIFRKMRIYRKTCMMDLNQSEIVNYYKNQTIFITGGTGFLGKILIEKLLRVCDVERIYILVRAKKGKSTEERFENLFNFPCFDRLKSERDGFRNKISLIDGDCAKLNLGVTPEDQEILKKEVTCFIHAAANVKFDQSLRAAASNARAVRDALNFTKQMPKLKAFVFVSTAYSNCIHPFIGEKFYESPMTADELFNLLEDTSDDVLEKATSRILGQYPNTYIFTKCISESIIKAESKSVPVVIVRPAVVIPTVREPMAGWIDNFYGPAGISMAAFLGILRSFHCNPDGITNFVPCDFVSNIVLASAWFISERDQRDITIFNYVGRQKNYVDWRSYLQLMNKFADDYITIKAIAPHNVKFRKNYHWNKICQFFQHTLIAYIVDFFLIMTGKTPLAVKKCARFHESLDYLSYFSTNFWLFGTKNIDKLWNKMSDGDKELFNFNFENEDSSEVTRNGLLGCRLYLLKDPPETIPKAKKKFRKLKIASYAISTVLVVLSIYFGIVIVNFVI